MAAFNKRWVGTTGVYTLATNWAPISLRSPLYAWTLSGSGTTEYYLRLVGGTNPGISAPGAIYLNGTDTGAALSVGSITAGRYGYGDNDALGYSTVYVRLSDGADPDSKAMDWVQMYQIPVATDHVRIPAASGAITGVDQSTVAIGDFIVEDGYVQTIGSATAPLYIDPNRFEFSGLGTSYIDIFSAAIAPDIRRAKGYSSGAVGLYLTGSAMTAVTVQSGSVGIALVHGQVATATTVRTNGDDALVYIGAGTTLTSCYVINGRCVQRCNTTTSTVHGGTLVTEEACTITTLYVDGDGTAVCNSTGTIATLSLQSVNATADFSQSSESRVITDFTYKDGTMLMDDTYVTITNRPNQENGPKKLTMAPL